MVIPFARKGCMPPILMEQVLLHILLHIFWKDKLPDDCKVPLLG